MKNSKFKIYTLGCKVNQYDSSSLAGKLMAADFTLVKAGADLAIINTCAVTKSALAKDRQMVARARKENPDARIVITGCAPKVYKEEMAGLGADLVIVDREVEEILKKIWILDFGFWNKSKIGNLKSKIGCASIVGENRNDTSKSRYFIKVQDGCRQFCAYCVIPYARGELKSRPIAEVIAEVKEAVASGYREIVLCGIHLGLYGLELKTPTRIASESVAGGQNSKLKTTTKNSKVDDLTSLLKKLIIIPELGRVRLSSIEVNEVTDELIDLIKSSGKICRHLHIPLQSGKDKILKLMNRPYTTKIFASKIEKIRQAVPGISISTDVIVGFPGESDADFKSTVELVKKTDFSKIHVFPFSAHEKTPAANMTGQVSEKEKRERSKHLNSLSSKLGEHYQRKFKGKQLAVIIDGRSKDGRYRAKTEFYFDIEFSSWKKYFPGDLVKVKDWRLLGREI